MRLGRIDSLRSCLRCSSASLVISSVAYLRRMVRESTDMDGFGWGMNGLMSLVYVIVWRICLA